MPRDPAIKYPAYRRFDSAREEANNAMMALLIGSRLAAHLLAANSGSLAYLPQIYPLVAGIERMHLRPDSASSLLLEAEAHLSSMAIPYVWATYEVLVESSTNILTAAGNRGMTRTEKRKGLMGRHAYMGVVTRTSFDNDDLALLDLVRNIRISIVHYGRVFTPEVSAAWSALPPSASARWVGDAGRAVQSTRGHLDILSGELVGTLAITKHMARQISALLGTAVSTSTWSELIVEDFLENYPKAAHIVTDAPMLRRKMSGWTRMYYSLARVSDSELDAALRLRSL